MNNMNEQIEFFESKLRFEIDAFDLFTAVHPVPVARNYNKIDYEDHVIDSCKFVHY